MALHAGGGQGNGGDFFQNQRPCPRAEGERYFRVVNRSETPAANTNPQAWLAEHERRLALLYTYSLIIALVCGTAGLPHILVRFYTNPDGVAAKRTTMWVMILIGVFYVFPPIFGVMGRNLMPELTTPRRREGHRRCGAEAPADSQQSGWGSILSGITCAGAFAAFMSTFSGLLVSLTGALSMMCMAGCSIRNRRRTSGCACSRSAPCCVAAAPFCSVSSSRSSRSTRCLVGLCIAATSYFPLLFLSTWWRGVTTKGAATGMLAGGTLSLVAIASTMFADQASWAKGIADFYAGHPLCAFWQSSRRSGACRSRSCSWSSFEADEDGSASRYSHEDAGAARAGKLGLKQEYIQEHQTH
jgi:Na+(H+)/acetate symporter ActP